jgi:hypothetical protein
MKKLVLTAVAIMAVLPTAACGSKKDDVIVPAPTQAETQAPEEYEEETEKPTERVAHIQSVDDYDYEVIDGEVTITKYTGTDTVVEVPSEIDGVKVTFIDDHAFEFKYKLTSVTLPDTITGIGESAFSDCSALEYVNIPEGVTHIDRGAFIACTSLTEITIPAAVTSVQEETFTACDSLTSLTIENPTLAYENWGLEELPNVVIYAPEGSETAQWASEMGKLAQ